MRGGDTASAVLFLVLLYTQKHTTFNGLIIHLLCLESLRFAFLKYHILRWRLGNIPILGNGRTGGWVGCTGTTYDHGG